MSENAPGGSPDVSLALDVCDYSTSACASSAADAAPIFAGVQKVPSEPTVWNAGTQTEVSFPSCCDVRTGWASAPGRSLQLHHLDESLFEGPALQRPSIPIREAKVEVNSPPLAPEAEATECAKNFPNIASVAQEFFIGDGEELKPCQPAVVPGQWFLGKVTERRATLQEWKQHQRDWKVNCRSIPRDPRTTSVPSITSPLKIGRCSTPGSSSISSCTVMLNAVPTPHQRSSRSTFRIITEFSMAASSTSTIMASTSYLIWRSS